MAPTKNLVLNFACPTHHTRNTQLAMLSLNLVKIARYNKRVSEVPDKTVINAIMFCRKVISKILQEGGEPITQQKTVGGEIIALHQGDVLLYHKVEGHDNLVAVPEMPVVVIRDDSINIGERS